MNKLIWIPLACLTACYGAAPPRPAAIPLPDLRAGAAIDLDTEQNTTMDDVEHESKTCPDGVNAGPECIVTRYTEREPVTHTKTTATYDGASIDYAQFLVMTDPDRDRKLAHLDELSRHCRRANTPRYLGMGLAAGGLAAMLIGAGAQNKIVFDSSWALFAAGGGAYAFGYYGYGGKQCNEARALYHDVEVSSYVGATEVYGETYAATMKELADRFNAGTAQASN
jgi:hypothetical protein